MLLGLFRLSWKWVKLCQTPLCCKKYFIQSVRIVTIFPIIVDRGDNNMPVIT